MAQSTFHNAVDSKTGLPADYDTFFSAYRPLVMATAERLNIPLQDREDATQEVQLKFWAKDGLTMYDPSRNTKFATLLRNWAGMFMLQERDKVKKQSRYVHRDPLAWAVEVDQPDHESKACIEEFDSTYESSDFVENWLDTARIALRQVGKEYLIPLLELCVVSAEDNKTPTRARIAEVVDVPLSRATPLIRELRATLTEMNLGVDSLY